MFNSNYKDKQAEFFADSSDISKKARKTKLNLAKIVVSLSYENIIILSIGLLMLLIVCYSLGVEKGKDLVSFKSELATLPQAEKKMEVEVAPKKYTIQVAAFRNAASVKQELEQLNKRGYQPFVVNRGGVSELCVGNYENQDEAYSDLNKLKKIYSDSYLRRR